MEQSSRVVQPCYNCFLILNIVLTDTLNAVSGIPIQTGAVEGSFGVGAVCIRMAVMRIIVVLRR